MEDDGMILAVRLKVPSVFTEKDLVMLHSDVPESKRDSDFFAKKLALCQKRQQLQDENTSDEFGVIAYIPLEFPVAETFKMSTKGDHEGTIILYIDLEELTAKPREVTASDEWSMLKAPISDEEK